MELVPPIHEHSAKEPHTTAEYARRQWVGRMALHSPYEDGSDAYSDLGGGLPSHRPKLDIPKYPTGLDETILFAGRQQRESVDPRHLEVVRAYELSLDSLTSAQFHDLSLKDQMRVAVAGHNVLKLTERRAEVLQVDGNFEHPAFLHYGFSSQDEANTYAAELKLLQHELMTREVVSDIEQAYKTLKSKSRPSTLADLKKQTRDLTVSVNDGGKVAVGNKAVAK